MHKACIEVRIRMDNKDKTDSTCMVSICIAVYNHEKYIAQCLNSFFEQKMDFPYEILIGNDKSTDGSAKVLENYADRVTVINREQNLGLCANQYDLFLRAKGKYVFYFSGDDYMYDPLALQKQVDFLEAHPEYYAVSAWNYMYRHSDGKMYANYTEDFIREFTMEDFLRDGEIPTTHGLVRNTFREDWETNGYLVKGARNNEEMKLWTYTLSKGKRYILPEYFHVYRNVDEEGMSNYNSTHTMLDMFEDNYGDLCMLRREFKGRYNYTPMILKKCNAYSLRCDSVGTLLKLLGRMKAADVFRLLWYKVYLKTHGYHAPAKWSQKEYLILKE
jgi:glycosyltransferase involved in cell wall biosynthesis